MTKRKKRKNPLSPHEAALAHALADADLERALECLQTAPAEAEWDTVVIYASDSIGGMNAWDYAWSAEVYCYTCGWYSQWSFQD